MLIVGLGIDVDSAIIAPMMASVAPAPELPDRDHRRADDRQQQRQQHQAGASHDMPPYWPDSSGEADTART
ncbi:hypothetical protein A1D31_38785 [Bradyrhizobium liaoningense]|nr:hypothetical protein A1D31_38785 [Bradyrhizobium liaoningense]